MTTSKTMPPQALYYITRPGPMISLPSGGRSQAPARLVPLIAVDQLPTWVDIIGVPRQLKPEQAVEMLAIATSDLCSDTEVKGEHGQDGEGFFEVRIIPERAPTTPRTPSTPKVMAEKRKCLASLTPSPEVKENNVDKTSSTQETKIMANKEVAMKAKEAQETKTSPAAAPPPTTPVQLISSVTSTIPPALITADSDLPGSNKGTSTGSSADGAPFETICGMLAALNEKPLSQHFLNGDVEILTVRHNVQPRVSGISTKDSTIVNNLIDIDMAVGRPVPARVDGRAGEKPVDKLDKLTDTKTISTTPVPEDPGLFAADRPKVSTNDKNEKKDTISNGTESPPEKAKACWSAQKKRGTNSVKPCRYWCRYGTCAYGDNCRYAHVMPQTPEGLKAVDLERLPAWWTRRASRGHTATSDDGRGGASGSGRQATSPAPPPVLRLTRSNSTASSTSGGPYLRQFMTTTSSAAVPPPYQTRHNRAHSSVSAQQHPYIGSAMQTSRPPRTWKLQVSSTGATKGSGSSNDTNSANTSNTSPPHLAAKKKLLLLLQKE